MSVLRYSAKCNSIYRYLLHFGTTIPTVFPPVPGCHHVSALAILPLPVVASAVARRQAACRLLVHTVCQAGMKAGGRWLSGHEADGCRRGPNRFPGASAGVGQCPGSRPAAAGAVWPVDGGRPAFTYGPCRVAVRPVPWRVGGLVVAGVVFFPSGKGEFLFSAQFSPAIICILSSLCVIFAIDNQHPAQPWARPPWRPLALSTQKQRRKPRPLGASRSCAAGHY